MTTTSLRKGLLGVFLQKSSTNWLNRCISCHTKQSFSFAATHKKERRSRVSLHRGLHTEKTECIQEKDAPRELKFAQLTGRGLLRISGPDATELLQGLQTNDTGLLWGRNGVMYTMFLNTQVCDSMADFWNAGDSRHNGLFFSQMLSIAHIGLSTRRTVKKDRPKFSHCWLSGKLLNAKKTYIGWDPMTPVF